MTTLHLRKSIGRSRLRLAFFLIPLVLVHFPAFAANDGNTSFGVGALPGNTTGHDNTAVGFEALARNTSGSSNTAYGFQALINNTDGIDNTANGFQALARNTTGRSNTATGHSALIRNNGSGNIALGNTAGADLTTGDRNIDIGNRGVAAEAHTIRIGDFNQTRTFIAGISGRGVTGAGVVVNAAGQLGTAPSSQRFKKEIKPMDKMSQAILALEPVTFRYKKEVDPEGTPQFGLLAEDVEKVNPGLVLHDKEGKPYSVRYEAVNAMLLNEFLKEHRTVQELKSNAAKQQANIAQQQEEIKALTATVKELGSQIQKVSAQVETSRSAPQTVVDNH